MINVLNGVLVCNEDWLLHVTCTCMTFCSLVEHTYMTALFQACAHTSRLISPGKWAVMHLCVRGVSFSPLSAIFLLDFGTVTTVGNFFCFILFMHITDCKYQEFDAQTEQEFEIPNGLSNYKKFNWTVQIEINTNLNNYSQNMLMYQLSNFPPTPTPSEMS